MLGTNEDQRPAQAPTKAVNILLMGADNPQRLVKKPTVAALLEDGEWDPGAYRSDTMMVVHIPADRKAAYIVSVPRDSYVPIFDAEGNEHDRNKINESFSAYGPFGTLRTIENLSGVRLNHLAVIDYAGFNDLTTAIGGVDVYIPETVVGHPAGRTSGAGLDPPRGRARAAVRPHAPRPHRGRLRPHRPPAELPARRPAARPWPTAPSATPSS